MLAGFSDFKTTEVELITLVGVMQISFPADLCMVSLGCEIQPYCKLKSQGRAMPLLVHVGPSR